MLAAFFEWFLWLSAFLYCLFKVYRKAENTSTRVLAILMAIVFTLLRYGVYEIRMPHPLMLNHRAIFLPIMVVTLPLPAQVTQYFPREFVSILQWFAFWTFSALLTIPWLLCIYQVHLDCHCQHVDITY